MKTLGLLGLLAISTLLDNLAHIRVKQEAEEANTAVRVIQPVALPVELTCTPAQQARQRIRDLAKSKKTSGNVTVEAGHGTLNINNNQGKINNSVNVQIVNENEQRNCL